MNVIGVGWAQEILRRYWRVPAATALAPTLGTEVVPTFDLTDPPLELAALAGVLPCHGSGTQGIVGAEFGRISLNNNTSDRLFLVEGLWAWVGVAGPIGARYRILGAAGTTGGTVGVRDSRFATARIQGIIGQNTSAAQVVGTAYARVALTTSPLWIPYTCTIAPVAAPGNGLVIEAETGGVVISASFLWRERLLSPGGFELTGL